MIYAFTGKTGSGKTYNMVRFAFHEWKRGADIYSNTVLFFDKKKKKNLFWWLPDTLKKRFDKPRGQIIYFEDIAELLEVKNGIILIDEAQVLFNARNWENLPYEFQYKLQQHRKHRLDLYCTTQNMGTIDITYRRLVQVWIHHYDVFALLWKRNPSWLTLHLAQYKDIDQLYNKVDDLTVDTVKTRFFFIHKFKRKLYDTMYDIGFRAFKSVWINKFENGIFKQVVWIIPKEMLLKDVLRLKSLYQLALGPNKSATSRTIWKD